MGAKLTEKNLALLDKLGVKDSELGLATPAMACKETAVKDELPSLSTLKELIKTSKTA